VSSASKLWYVVFKKRLRVTKYKLTDHNPSDVLPCLFSATFLYRNPSSTVELYPATVARKFFEILHICHSAGIDAGGSDMRSTIGVRSPIQVQAISNRRERDSENGLTHHASHIHAPAPGSALRARVGSPQRQVALPSASCQWQVRRPSRCHAPRGTKPIYIK
jgi:hypothetical protein